MNKHPPPISVLVTSLTSPYKRNKEAQRKWLSLRNVFNSIVSETRALLFHEKKHFQSRKRAHLSLVQKVGDTCPQRPHPLFRGPCLLI